MLDCVSDSVTSRETLLARTSELFSTPLDAAHPLWRLAIIRSSDSTTTHCGILLSYHHSYADGVSGLEFFSALCRKTRDESLVTAACALRASRAHRAHASEPTRVSDIAKNLLRVTKEVLRTRGQSSLHGTNSADRRFLTCDIPTNVLRAIQSQFHVSANDVFLAATAGAIRRYHAARNMPTSDQVALVPTSFRTLNQRHLIDNRISAVGISLPCQNSSPNDTPFAALTQIAKSTASLKSSGEFGAFLLAAKISRFLPRLWQRTLCEYQARHTNYICTNVPGPKQQKFIAGAAVCGQYPLAALMREHGIAFGGISYHGIFGVALVYDPAIVDNAGEILSAFQAELQQLANCASEQLDAAIVPDTSEALRATSPR